MRESGSEGIVHVPTTTQGYPKVAKGILYFVTDNRRTLLVIVTSQKSYVMEVQYAWTDK